MLTHRQAYRKVQRPLGEPRPAAYHTAMRREPLFRNLTAQRAAVGAGMVVAFMTSLIAAWLVSGAALSDPLGPIRAATTPTASPARRDANAEPVAFRSVELGGIDLPVPETYAEEVPSENAALAEVPHRSWANPDRPDQRLTAFTLRTPTPQPPQALARQTLQQLWPTQAQAPIAIEFADRETGLRAFQYALFPTPGNQRQGSVDLLSVATRDGLTFLVLGLHDTSANPDRIEPLLNQQRVLSQLILQNTQFRDE